MQSSKQEEEHKKNALKVKMKKTTLTQCQQLEAEEKTKLLKSKKLIRSLE